jgi:hypothetical protein
MIRANIYSLSELEPEQSVSIREGLDLICGYIGESIATRNFKVAVAQEPNGFVRPERVGVRNFDHMVELHLLAVPLTRKSDGTERLGLAGVNSGVAFIDPYRTTPLSLRSTTAHEAAHALGFLLPSAEQAVGHDKSHCKCPDCLMHTQRLTDVWDEEEYQKYLGIRNKGIIGRFKTRGAPEAKLHIQEDFCNPCQGDITDYGARHIGELRTKRLVRKKVWFRNA